MKIIAGNLEEALEEYKRSLKFGVERAAVHIRNVRSPQIFSCDFIFTPQVGAKILGKQMKAPKSDKSVD